VFRGLSSTRSQPESGACHTGNMAWGFPGWACELAWLSEDDRDLPLSLDAVNLVLNRARLAASTGSAETAPNLASRPFRLCEYVWLYKPLGLSGGGMEVLDLGGPATHLSILAAIAGCHVTSVDINPESVQANECARALKVPPSKTHSERPQASPVFSFLFLPAVRAKNTLESPGTARFTFRNASLRDPCCAV
jgi:hypothetical protein